MSGTIRSGAVVDGFRVGERIGAGGMGEVWEARDLRLGRRVALKVIRPGRADDPRTVARFLDEARITARLNHPNVVILFGAGEWQGLPYVVLELLEGESLRSRLRTPPPFAEALRIAHDVARAVEAGHAVGIVHGDLKPENVVLATDGRPRVVDFGLARAIRESQPDAPASGGTPEYLAPEQWRGAPSSPASDVWSLGVILRELFCGLRPYDLPDDGPGGVPALRRDVTSPEPAPPPPNALTLPPDLVELLTLTLAKEPASRPTCAELTARLGRRLRGPTSADPAASPFRGLLPFHEEDARWFFGREREIALYVERLRDRPILPVVGASGAGKSSFLLAGVVPRLREQGPCVLLTLRPGASPVRSLASLLEDLALPTWTSTQTRSTGATPSPVSRATLDALHLDSDEGPLPSEPTVEVAPREDLGRRLLEAPGTLHARLRELAAQAGRVVLVVDQLEEVFTQGADPADRDAFLAAVFGAIDDPREPIRVLATLRDDFLGRLAHHLPAERVPREFFVLDAPDAATLVRALGEATAAAGARTDDPRLYEDLVGELAGSPAALPLAQFAARQLWDRRDRERDLVRRADWVAAGGAVGLLARHADEVLAGLPPASLKLARELLLALVTADGTRRAVDEAEARLRLGARGDRLPLEGQRVLERLTGSRLVVVHRAAERTTLELAHDSLVTTWPQLARWLDESRERLRHGQELDDAARLWDQRGRRSAELWQGDALRDVDGRAPSPLSPLAHEFLAAARALREVEAARATRRRAAIGLLACLVVVGSVGLAIVFNGREQAARRAARQARAAESEALATSARASWERGDGRVARAQLRAAAEVGAPDAARDLWWLVERSPILYVSDGSGVTEAALAPDGRRLVVLDGSGTAEVVDVASGRRERRPGTEVYWGCGWSVDGARVLLVGADGAGWWTPGVAGALEPVPAPAGQFLQTVVAGENLVVLGYGADERGVLDVYGPDGSHRTLDAPPLHFRAVAQPDGGLVTMPLRGGALMRWDLATGTSAPIGDLPAGDGASGLLPVGDAVLTIGGRTRSFGTDTPSGPGPGVPHTLRGLAALAGGGAVAVDDQGDVWVGWRRAGEAPRLVAELAATSERPWRPLMGGVAAAGRLLVWHEQTAWLLDVEKLSTGAPDAGHRGAVAAIAPAPDGRVFTAGFEGEVYAWSEDAPTRPQGPFATHPEAVTRVAVSPDGRLLLTGSDDETAALWRADAPRAAVARLGNADDVVMVGFDGEDALTFDLVGGFRRWAIPEAAQHPPWYGVLAPRSTLTGVRGYHAVFVPRRGLVIAGEDGTVARYDVDGRPTARFPAHEAQVAWVEVAPDDSVWTVGYDGTLRHHPPAGGDPRDVADDVVSTSAVALLPDGGVVYFANGGLAIQPPDGERVLVLTDLAPSAVAVGAGGRLLWVGFADGSVRALRVGEWTTVGGVAVVRDGARFGDGRVRVGDGERPPAGPLEEALAGSVTAAIVDGGACILRPDRILERWSEDRLLWSRPGVTAVQAVGDRCVWREAAEGGPAVFVAGPGGRPDVLGTFSSLAGGSGIVLLGGDDLSVLLDSSGSRTVPAVDATAVVEIGGRVFVGKDGGLGELGSDGTWRREVALEDLPSSGFAALADASPWVAAGFLDGTVGLWDPASGRRVWSASLLGRARFLEVSGGVATFGTDLDDRVGVDLGRDPDPCGWRRAVLGAIAVTWEDGAVVPASTKHPAGCPPTTGTAD